MAGVGSDELCPSFGPWLNPASTQGICKLYSICYIGICVKLCLLSISNNAVNFIYHIAVVLIDQYYMPYIQWFQSNFAGIKYCSNVYCCWNETELFVETVFQWKVLEKSFLSRQPPNLQG